MIVGPTASGKSELALQLAASVGGEVVSADSQQVYRGMDVGTGKVGGAERARVPHHLLDVVDPDDEMTAARYLALADAAIADVAGRGRKVVVAGGTMLYVRVLLRGLFQGPGADPAIRARLDAEAEALGNAALHRRLAEVDPELAPHIEPRDRRRIVRALEVFEVSGEPMSAHQRRNDFRQVPRRYPARVIALRPERAALYARIDRRVEEMMDSGLLQEVERLRAAGYGPDLRSQQAIGYAELHRHLDGALSLGEAVASIQRNSRRYARRQLAWYRRDPEVEPRADLAAVDLADLGRYLRGEPT